MLKPNNIKEAAYQAASDLRNFTADRQAKRTADALLRFTKDWKQTSAKAFMKHIRNDNKAPLASFLTPTISVTSQLTLKELISSFVKLGNPFFNVLRINSA